MKFVPFATALAAASTLMVAPIASAEDFAIEFKYDAEALQTYEGAVEVHRQMKNAVKDACGLDTARTAREQSQATSCYRDTMDRAVSKVGSKTLVKAHANADGRA
ncbi:MAG: UrcA family protein [Pseudomonadota bacterium]